MEALTWECSLYMLPVADENRMKLRCRGKAERQMQALLKPCSRAGRERQSLDSIYASEWRCGREL